MEGVADQRLGLPAAVKRDVRGAPGSDAGGRHVDEAGRRHAVCCRVGQELALVELHKGSTILSRWRVQWAVHMLQDRSRLVVVAVVDERAARHVAGVSSVLRDEAVARLEVVDELNGLVGGPARR